MEAELPAWPRKQGVGAGGAGGSGQVGPAPTALRGLSLQPVKFKVKCGSQSSQRQASLTSSIPPVFGPGIGFVT